MATFFTSDTHFGHANIIKYCDRPFANVEDMDRQLVERWNRTVQHGDTVFHLGDFAFGNGERVEQLLFQLHGVKVLITGNHDSKSTCRARGWAGVHGSYTHHTDDMQTMWHMIHRPDDAERAWALDKLRPDSPNKRVVLHGHCHGQRGHNPYEAVPGVQYLDVGVDTGGWQHGTFQPIPEADIKYKLAALQRVAPCS